MFSKDEINAVLAKINNTLSTDIIHFTNAIGMNTHQITNDLIVYELHCPSESLNRNFIFLIAKNETGNTQIIHRSILSIHEYAIIIPHIKEVLRSYLYAKNITPLNEMRQYLNM